MVRPKLTKMRLDYARSQPIYCAVIMDLYQQEVITKEQAEVVLGFDIDDSLYPESPYSKLYKEKKNNTPDTPDDPDTPDTPDDPENPDDPDTPDDNPDDGEDDGNE